VNDFSSQLAPALLAWWDEHGRHDLPWQSNPTPYRVWVSEIMLQQTQVATVARYYGRFMQRFPSLRTLAGAQQDDVLHLWSGLGYYSRARNLHKAAQQVAEHHGGRLPKQFDRLVELPGIGRSTAGAILALACDQHHAILDGNAKRVLARVFGVEGWSGSSANLRELWALAEVSTPVERVANYTQAIMDLGASLCSRSKPACARCPLAENCHAFRNDLVARIPAPKPRKERPLKATVMVMLQDQSGDVLLQKRPPSGIWGGLWSFPELADADVIDEWCSQMFAAEPAAQASWPVVRHSFSHYDLDITPVAVTIDRARSLVMDGDEWLWYNTRSPAGIGLAAPVAKLLETLAAENGVKA